MDNELDYEDIETVTLEFEDGDSEEFEVIGTFEYESDTYIALTPYDDAEDSEDEPLIYLFACTEEEDGFLDISEIEDDDLYEAVANRFDELSGGTRIDG
ncbi:MAG: DUF1292 domain-containing protein [Atopobiaceae bacterium]|nr:DUF1292 domain-containing protein [Atopobiaceae bacterium]